MWSKKLLLLTIAGFLGIFQSFGQAAKSPFTTFGLGDRYGNQLVHAQGMGGVGIANPQYWYLNNQNPAALTFNRLTTLSAGYLAESRIMRNSENERDEFGGGNMNYFIMAFPVKITKWSTALGLTPYSNVDYKFQYTDEIIGSTNTVDVTESGSGGYNQFYWSNGVKITDDLSIGLKSTFLFSSAVREYSNKLTNTTQLVSYMPAIYERTTISDLTFQAGILYSKDSITSKNYRINVGFVYDHASNVNANKLERIERRTSSGSIIEADTLTFISQGNITLPRGMGFGIAFSKAFNWTISADVYLNDWTVYRSFEGSNEGLQRSMFAGLGAEFTPNPASVRSYFERVTYRTGLNYIEEPYSINGVLVKDFGINFGLSFPVAPYSSLDVALKLGRRGNRFETDIEENYIKLYFGVTFNDRWFIKRRFD